MKILITGVAGFIGSAVAERLLQRGDEIIGIDSLNEYYEVSLKLDRLEALKPFENFTFSKIDLADRGAMESLFESGMFERVIHLGAQAGVRYSIDNPHAYIDSNIVGTMNILEGCRHHGVKHLVYASSSSVYGANETLPFSVHDNVDHPVSLYAATKKSNELMAHTYSHLYGLPTTGLRFFTVYGPWGRPDMAPIKFAKAICENKPIDVYNLGKHRRDFTYIDDIVTGTILAMDNLASSNAQWSGLNPDPASSQAPWKVYNIGNSEPVELMRFISTLEKYLGKEAKKNMLPMQPGDVEATFADVSALQRDTGYSPSVSIDEGVKRFVEWFKEYYK
ncbi:NAD-dependent epimerase [uncultured Oceanicoccus sp.]|uniref:NAD-dependent epimerase n=1 Tax=uncultured Oceanicoccus sp. TaxID=1706381 RepID=UPI0030DB9E66